MKRGKRIDKEGKKYVQIIHTEHLNVKHIAEVRERKLWSGEKVSIPAGSAKLLKVKIEGDWRGEGFHQAVHKLYMWRTMLKRI